MMSCEVLNEYMHVDMLSIRCSWSGVLCEVLSKMVVGGADSESVLGGYDVA